MLWDEEVLYDTEIKLVLYFVFLRVEEAEFGICNAFSSTVQHCPVASMPGDELESMTTSKTRIQAVHHHHQHQHLHQQ